MRKTKGLLVVHLVILMGLALSAGGVMASGDAFHYITPMRAKEMIESGEALTLLDIQVEDEYNRHHIRGSVATYAYPVKSDEERARLDRLIPDLRATAHPVVIICPRGGGGAKRTYEYLASRGIAENRMFILEKGQSGWPYPELIEGN